MDYDYLKSVEADGTALLGIAADNDLELLRWSEESLDELLTTRLAI